MTASNKKLGITDVVLRDAHQSLFATRLRIDDMLPIAEKLDQVGFWSLETWGGATFDSCIRYLGEDPWDRLRELKKAMPNTPQQMLFRGQNILGYRHYADDVVEKFVERAAHNGMDVFRVFDAMNDVRNLQTALRAVKKVGKHAQGTISYTVSPVHTLEMWVDMGRKLQDMGADSIAIKDMAGLLRPYEGYELVKQLKAACDIPVHLHCHATTGLSTATILKCVEAGIDNVDTAISSMSMTYGHSPTESVVAILEGTGRDTGLDINLLEDISNYFREVRKKYAKFEGSLRGVDSRILVAQVPGGMLTNMESQLRDQGAIRCPRSLRLGLAFPSRADPVKVIEKLLRSNGFDSAEELRFEFALPEGRLICRPLDPKASRLAVLGGPERAVLEQALLLGLCNAQLFDSRRPVLWTQTSLTRGLELFDGFFECEFIVIAVGM